MKRLSKLIMVLLSIVLAANMLTNAKAEAAEKVGKPTFKVKYINSKTGIRITIPKCKGADAYNIHIKSSGTIYDGYKDNESCIEIDMAKGKNTVFEIPGLTKGNYEISIAAVKLNWLEGEEEYYREELTLSKVKKIKIKGVKIKAASKTYDFSDKKAGDTILFGSYEQDGIMNDGEEDIEWIVLSKNDKEMLVMSRYALECLPYNVDDVDTTWADCSLRKWLNSTFYTTAFTKAERSMIRQTKLVNADNPEFDTNGGKATKDNVFILSVDDVSNPDYGFNPDINADDELRCPESTAYVWNQRQAFIDGNMIAIYTWLRNPGYYNSDAACIAAYGYVMNHGSVVINPMVCVRPIINIKIQ